MNSRNDDEGYAEWGMDVPGGGDWWQASDSRWYPPEAKPEPPLPPSPPQPSERQLVASDSDEAADNEQLASADADPPGSTELGAPARQPNRRPWLVVGGVTLIGVAAGLVYLLTRQDVYDDVMGRIKIGAVCSDLGGYSDVPNGQIIVRDVNEKFLIEMEPSPIPPTTGVGTCNAFFYGEDLPKLDRYIIDSGRRGQIFVSSAEFEKTEPGYVQIFDLTLG